MKKYNRYLLSVSVIFILALLVYVPYVKCELGAGGVLPVTPNAQVNTYNSGLDITPDENLTEQRVAITKFIGDVRVIRKYQNKEEPARLNMPISSGDTIITGEGAKAQIVFKDGSTVTLKSNSKFTLDTAVRNSKAGTYVSRMQLKVGQLRAKLKKQKPGSSFEIKTPAAVCSARGTIFFLKVFATDSGLINSLVFVEEGKVYFYDVSGQYGHIIQELGTFDASRFGTGDPNTATEEEIAAWLADWGIGLEGALGFSSGPTGEDRNSSGNDVNNLNNNNLNNNGQNDINDDNRIQGNLFTQGGGAGQITTDVDTDGDGLYDLEETLLYHTDPDNPDSDEDGLTDGDEVNLYESDPNKEDSDDDDLKDGDEVNTYKSDPNKEDSDGDGIKDGDEVKVWDTDPLTADADADVDHVPDIEDAFDADANTGSTDPAVYGSRDSIREETKSIMERNSLRSDIQDIVDDANLRELDAAMTRIADAQTGKVLVDRNGYRVRVEQYILRPDSNTIQLLNINLRTEEAGSLAGLNTLDWTTRFNQSIDSLTGAELRDLPWHEYLLGTEDKPIDYGSEMPDYYPDWTQVTLNNPQGDSFMEKKRFADLEIHGKKETWRQEIKWDKVSFDGGESWHKFKTVDIRDGENNPVGFKINPKGLGRSYNVNVTFYVISDTGEIIDSGKKKFDSIWEALAVNMPQASGESEKAYKERQIGDNNLEISLGSKFGGGPKRYIDLIYIPWDKQNWNESHTWQEEEEPR